MLSSIGVVFFILLNVARGEVLNFPPGFKFGVATSAYQIEGAWNVSDKTPSIWDVFSHERHDVTNGDNGDIACDSYHLWREDVKAAVDLGVHYYRFSINWPRLLPNGFSNKISDDGAKYYNDLINELIKNNIEPVITLYHWELPQSLQNLGGWVNPLISDWFEDYARVVYSLYGDRVTTWVTINEPLVVCDLSYNTLLLAPGLVDSEFSMYICNKNLLLAHAKAWRLYDKEYKPKYHGRVAIDNHVFWLQPENPEEQNITDLVRDYHYGRYIDPIYTKEGGWPPVIEKIIAENSKKLGYSQSRLLPFTEEERKLVQGTYDYFGFNHYISRMVRKAREGEVIGDWPLWGVAELGAVIENRPEWEYGPMPIFSIYPKGLRLLLSYLKDRYGDHDFVIMESGIGMRDPTLEDDLRVQFYKDYLEQVLLSIHEDGVNLTAYTAWSMLDNYEWPWGYEIKYGLYHIDFTDPQRTRTARKSAKHYAEVIKNHSLDVTKRTEL